MTTRCSVPNARRTAAAVGAALVLLATGACGGGDGGAGESPGASAEPGPTPASAGTPSSTPSDSESAQGAGGGSPDGYRAGDDYGYDLAAPGDDLLASKVYSAQLEGATVRWRFPLGWDVSEPRRASLQTDGAAFDIDIAARPGADARALALELGQNPDVDAGDLTEVQVGDTAYQVATLESADPVLGVRVFLFSPRGSDATFGVQLTGGSLTDSPAEVLAALHQTVASFEVEPAGR